MDVEKTRLRIPADTAALHRPGSGYRSGKLRIKADVERAAHDMLAVLHISRREHGLRTPDLRRRGQPGACQRGAFVIGIAGRSISLILVAGSMAMVLKYFLSR